LVYTFCYKIQNPFTDKFVDIIGKKFRSFQKVSVVSKSFGRFKKFRSFQKVSVVSKSFGRFKKFRSFQKVSVVSKSFGRFKKREGASGETVGFLDFLDFLAIVYMFNFTDIHINKREYNYFWYINFFLQIIFICLILMLKFNRFINNEITVNKYEKKFIFTASTILLLNILIYEFGIFFNIERLKNYIDIFKQYIITNYYL